jgi:rhamnogalacturonan acetylesterase
MVIIARLKNNGNRLKSKNRIMSNAKKWTVAVLLFVTLCALKSIDKKPVLFIIGDSTVQNNDGNGKNDYWGWGTLLKPYLDTTKITLQNHAKSGTSTRTFISDGRWTKILQTLKPGDFVIMQFGHNDQADINDSTRAKGTLKGTGEQVEQIINLKTKQPETVHTYGWYMRKFIRETKEKGATPIVCSLVPREKWKATKVNREIEYVDWAQEVAKAEGAYFINLNEIIVNKWEQMGPDAVRAFFPGDHTHTNRQGAQLNALSVVEGLRANKNIPLNNFLK